MPRYYWECPCCENQVWVHSFWGAAWKDGICLQCRDSHGNSYYSNCSVNGPRRRRREDDLRRQAEEEARQRERQRREKERERTEREERERYEREMRELAQRRAEALRKKREEDERERLRIEELMRKEIKDKEEAARKIRETMKKEDPYKEFKKFKTAQFVKDIAKRALDVSAMGEIIGEKVDSVKQELKKQLKEEFEQIKPEVIRYKRYSNAMKSTSTKYLAEFEKVFETSVQSVEDVADLLEDLKEADDDEEKQTYQQKMAAKMDSLYTAAVEISGELAVVEAYYDKMISDAKWFLKMADEYKVEHEVTLDADFKGMENDADNIQSQRHMSFAQNTTVEASYEIKSYKRNVDGVFSYLGNQMWDGIRRGAAATADVVRSPAHLAQMGVYGASWKTLVQNTLIMHEKIDSEKHETAKVKFGVHVAYDFYDGDKHKEKLKQFLSKSLEQMKESMNVEVPKLNANADAIRARFDELDAVKDVYLTPMKKQVDEFKKKAKELKRKLDEMPLKKARCELMADEWTKLANEMKDIMNEIKIKNAAAKKKVENIQDFTANETQ
eukprot:CAMPEP_0197032102 /NCGR_PEP_ID=MMETSP1384-20130603/10859_1 /TAXON_ID=29189 /ORGANISM="Ammonia sp." /LENGTH=556 /DNA_ID=CAMNT_0042461707 /DNA_START=34 /DNA_END=1704 /DNA_ORIENTATION=-